jgi:hypothetical protein
VCSEGRGNGILTMRESVPIDRLVSL